MNKKSILLWVLIGFLIIGFGWNVYSNLSWISDINKPFSFSEFGWILDSSLFFRREILCNKPPYPMLDPGRAFLSGLVLLLPGTTLMGYRIWSAIIIVLVDLTAAYALAKRYKSAEIPGLLVFLFTFIFLEQGPIIFSVLLIVPLLILLYKKENLIRNTFLIALLSIWGGFNRINWAVIPGLIMSSIYLVETKYENKRFFAYFKIPLIYMLTGVVSGLSSFIGYRLVSGNPVQLFDKNLNYSYYPERLFPNPAFPPGVLLAIILVSLPVLVIVIHFLTHNHKKIHILRLLSLFGILGGVLIVGLVISTRIGGTFNLHNLDGFLILELLLVLSISTGSFVLDRPSDETQSISRKFLGGISTFLIITPIIYTFLFNPPFVSQEMEGLDVADFTSQLEFFSGNKPVLFIDQIHLVVFEHIEACTDLRYERTHLMEMVMANNYEFLGEFSDHIFNKDYSIIISNGHYYALPETNDVFFPEERGWTLYVSRPIVDNYQIAAQFDDVYLWIPIE